MGKGRNKNSHTIMRNRGNARGDAKLNRVQKEELIIKAYERFIEGSSKHDIKNAILKISPVIITEDDAREIIRIAVERVDNDARQDAPVIINIHMEMYDQIYAYFHDIGNAAGMNKAMKAKEKLAGIAKENKVTINENRNTTIERKVEYDTSKLTPEQLERYNYLMNKIKA